MGKVARKGDVIIELRQLYGGPLAPCDANHRLVVFNFNHTFYYALHFQEGALQFERWDPEADYPLPALRKKEVANSCVTLGRVTADKLAKAWSSIIDDRESNHMRAANWTKETYNLRQHNCVDFARAFCVELGLDGYRKRGKELGSNWKKGDSDWEVRSMGRVSNWATGRTRSEFYFPARKQTSAYPPYKLATLRCNDLPIVRSIREKNRKHYRKSIWRKIWSWF